MGLARSGIMTAAGEPDMDPLAITGGIADQMGAIMMSYGILAALIARDKYGVGHKSIVPPRQYDGTARTERLLQGDPR